MVQRAIVRVQLTPTVKLKLDKLCDRRGMTQIAVMSRMVEWFCDQHELIQASILGQLSSETQADLAAKLLKKMSDEAGKE